MSSPHNEPLWYRHAWWVPGVATAIALALAVAALRPREHDVFLVAAILCALPWSLAMLVLDLSEGFADRAAFVVCIGLCVNIVLLWGATAWLRSRYRDRATRSSTVQAAAVTDY